MFAASTSVTAVCLHRVLCSCSVLLTTAAGQAYRCKQHRLTEQAQLVIKLTTAPVLPSTIVNGVKEVLAAPSVLS